MKYRVEKRKTQVYNPRQKEYNFLKNWRIVKYYIKRRYGISSGTLEFLLFLYNEDVFTKEQFKKYASMLSWNNRLFSQMQEAGLIKLWRKGETAKSKSLYELSHQAKAICNQTYKKLLQEEPISEDPYKNEIFKGSSYTDKVYKKLIKMMNEKEGK